MITAVRELRQQTPVAQTPSSSIPPPDPTPSTSTTSPRLAFPDKFDGSPSKCKGFLLQCSMFVSQQPRLYPTDDSRIAFVCSLLTGRALEWATAGWRDGHSAFPTFTAFIQRYKEVFDHTAGGKEPGEQLISRSSSSSHWSSVVRQGREMWISSGVRILSRLCDQLWRASDGWQEDPQCSQLASTYHSERASAFLRLCQLLPEIHPKFQHGSSPADFYDKEGESTPHLVSCSPSGFSNTQRTIHHRAHSTSSWPRTRIHCRGGRLQHRHRGSSFPMLGRPT